MVAATGCVGHGPHLDPDSTGCGSGACAGRAALLRARWNVAVLAELAECGRMELIALRHRGGQVRDFEWFHASPAATLQLGCRGADLMGQGLRGYFDDEDIGASLFLIYERALLSRREQLARVDIGGAATMHQVTPTPRGVAVRVTSPNAIEKVIAAQHALRKAEFSSALAMTLEREAVSRTPPHGLSRLPHPLSGGPLRAER